MSELAVKAQTVIDEFAKITGSDDRYKRIIDKGRGLEPVAESEKDDKFLIAGCMSRAWLIPKMSEERLYFQADSEAVIVKGIVAIVLEVVNGATAKEIAQFNFEFLKTSSLIDQISMNRRNGLASLIKQIKLYAAVYAMQIKKI